MFGLNLGDIDRLSYILSRYETVVERLQALKDVGRDLDEYARLRRALGLIEFIAQDKRPDLPDVALDRIEELAYRALRQKPDPYLDRDAVLPTNVVPKPVVVGQVYEFPDGTRMRCVEVLPRETFPTFGTPLGKPSE